MIEKFITDTLKARISTELNRLARFLWLKIQMHHEERGTKHAGYDGIATSGHCAQGIVDKKSRCIMGRNGKFLSLYGLGLLSNARSHGRN